MRTVQLSSHQSAEASVALKGQGEKAVPASGSNGGSLF